MAEVELKELEEEELVPEENDLIFVELGDVQAVKTTLDDSLVQVRGTFHWEIQGLILCVLKTRIHCLDA